MSLALVAPHVRYRKSYLSLVEEFDERGEPPIPFTIGFDCGDFDAFLARLANCAQGMDLPEGFVPHSTFWLLENGREVVGVANIRHRLNDKLRRCGGHIGYGIRPSARGRGLGIEILRHALIRAAELGVNQALVTVDKINTASARVILANGGALDSEEFLPEQHGIVQRYWIARNAG